MLDVRKHQLLVLLLMIQAERQQLTDGVTSPLWLLLHRRSI
jgi:hypothetical protein